MYGLATPPKTGPAILIYDIETTPLVGYAWRAYDTNLIAVKEDSRLLCFAYKWYGQDKTHFVKDGVPVRLHHLFDQADVLVAHNGDKFDERKANTAFLKAGLGPPSPYQTVDTLKQARKYFASTRSSLKELAREYGLSDKLNTSGFSLWLKCMDGDRKAWREMEQYNRQDVDTLEELYELVRPWMKTGHPNQGLWQRGVTCCPTCGGIDLQARGVRRTSVSAFQAFQCKDCGRYSRARLRDPDRVPALT